jgi:hypothetical protein
MDSFNETDFSALGWYGARLWPNFLCQLAPGKGQRRDASIKMKGRRRIKKARGTGGW